MTDPLPDLESQLERYGAVLRDELARPAPPVPAEVRPRRRSHVALAAAAVAFVVLVGAVAVSRAHRTQMRPTSNSTSSTTSTTASPRVDPHQLDAVIRAMNLVDGVRPGPGWTERATAPTAILRQPFSKPSVLNLALRTRFFVAPGPWDQVDAYIQADARPGFTSSGRGTTSTHGVDTAHGFTLSPVAFELPPEIRQEWVEFTTAPMPGGRIGVRVDAGIIWVPSRPADAVVPAGETWVAVIATWGMSQPARWTRTFHDRATIDELARTLNGLTIHDQGSQGGCVLDTNLRLTLLFGGSTAADTVTAVSNPACSSTSFSRPGVAGLSLDTGTVLLEQEARALGTTMSALEARAQAAATIPAPTTPTTR